MAKILTKTADRCNYKLDLEIKILLFYYYMLLFCLLILKYLLYKY